jgi:hypothetical protein
MSKRVHQINKKITKSKTPADAIRILQNLKKTNPDLYRKVQDQPGN